MKVSWNHDLIHILNITRIGLLIGLYIHNRFLFLIGPKDSKKNLQDLNLHENMITNIRYQRDST